MLFHMSTVYKPTVCMLKIQKYQKERLSQSSMTSEMKNEKRNDVHLYEHHDITT